MEKKKEPEKDGWIESLFHFYKKDNQPLSPKLKELLDSTISLEDSLDEYLNVEGMQVYQELVECREDISALEEKEAFLAGFSFGVKLLMEGRSHPSCEKMLSYALENPPDIE